MTGCQSNQNDQTSSKASTQATSEVAKSSASIKLTDSDKEITSKKVTYQSGDSLLEILKANFEVKEKYGSSPVETPAIVPVDPVGATVSK